MERAVDLNDKYASGHYNLACFYAKAGDKDNMLRALKNAIKWGPSQTFTDYREEARYDSDFEAFFEDEDFKTLCDRFPQDKGLRELYKAMDMSELDKVIEMGEEMLDSNEDRMAVLDAMVYSAYAIFSDLEEHGDVNLELYKHDDIDHYERKFKELFSMRKEALEEGLSSDVFENFKGDTVDELDFIDDE